MGNTYIAQLTNYVRGLAQDRSSALADFIAPRVVTGNASGSFKKFNDSNAFATYDTARAVGGPATRIEFGAGDGTYACKPQALEVAIDDFERQQWNSANNNSQKDPLSMEKGKSTALVNAAVNSHEKAVFAKIATAISAVGSVGVWSNDANDPFKELDAQILAIANEIGRMPNRIAMDINAWVKLRNNAKTIARQPGSSAIGLTEDQFKGMLMSKAIDVRIGTLLYNTAKPGGTNTLTNALAGNVFIFYGEQNPSEYDPSFAKTFSPDANGIGDVYTYRDDPNRSDIYATDWAEDIQVVSTIGVRRIAVT